MGCAGEDYAHRSDSPIMNTWSWQKNMKKWTFWMFAKAYRNDASANCAVIKANGSQTKYMSVRLFSDGQCILRNFPKVVHILPSHYLSGATTPFQNWVLCKRQLLPPSEYLRILNQPKNEMLTVFFAVNPQNHHSSRWKILWILFSSFYWYILESSYSSIGTEFHLQQQGHGFIPIK